MKNLAIALLLVLAGLFASADADAARRLGGGKSVGMQRDAVKPAVPPAQSAAPAKPATPPVAAPVPAPAPSGMSRWLGPLAGFAAGGLLASLFMGGGFGGIKMFDIILLAGMAFAAFMLFRAFTRRPQPAEATGGAGLATVPAPAATGYTAPAFTPPPATDRVIAPVIGSRIASGEATPAELDSAAAAPRVPPGFAVDPFLRQGRLAFLRMQTANDRGDVKDIENFCTPEMAAELTLQIQERGGAAQHTEIVRLEVDLLEVVAEGTRQIGSVRFRGEIREEVGAAAEPFDEVWHVVQDQPDGAWLLAGIQQVA